MRVLLTGGTGYLGRAIALALARRGHEPIVFARSASAAAAAGVPGRALDGDVRDAAALARAAEGCDALCHSAALVSIWRRDAREFDAVNVGGLANALAAAREHGIRRVVYTSSFLALPPAGASAPLRGNDYQRTKVAAERLAEDAAARGVPLVRVHPGVIYGPGPITEGNLVGRLVADHLRGRLRGIVGAERTWSFAFVGDVADAHVSALERAAPGSVYALGGENLPQIRLYEIVREQTGRQLPRRIPMPVARAFGALEELRAAVIGSTPLLTRATVDVLGQDWPLDSDRAQRELDYRITPLASGVAAVLESLSRVAPAGVPNLQP
ncbi:MAG TPA: NAD-dependent epimerase/dehydratase family protein [Vicinamibacterales bacterium]|nr:NAD-dependent epimerase/dehydratase family protein [Vicinamibacterales bacterium]